MCNVRMGRKLANCARCLSFWHSLITLISHSLGLAHRQFSVFRTHTLTRTRHTHGTHHRSTQTQSQKRVNKRKTWGKNYTQTLRCGYIEGKSIFPQQLVRPIAEFVYELGGKSNRKKTVGEKKNAPLSLFATLCSPNSLSRHSFYFSIECHVSSASLS